CAREPNSATSSRNYYGLDSW
nr:immunoglobulin heavy chain junction region [Macaca mulatta]